MKNNDGGDGNKSSNTNINNGTKNTASAADITDGWGMQQQRDAAGSNGRKGGGGGLEEQQQQQQQQRSYSPGRLLHNTQVHPEVDDKGINTSYSNPFPLSTNFQATSTHSPQSHHKGLPQAPRDLPPLRTHQRALPQPNSSG